MGIRPRTPQLQDIRSQLNERLVLIEFKIKDCDHEFQEERKALEAKHAAFLDGLIEERDSIKKMLEIEDRRHGEPQTLPAPTRKRPIPLDDFLVQAIKADGPQTKEQLRDWVASEGYAANGRAIHFTLINLVRGGRVQKLPDGRFAFSLAVRQAELKMGDAA